MEFTSAGEIIGEAHQVRTVEIADWPQLPDGEHQFVEFKIDIDTSAGLCWQFGSSLNKFCVLEETGSHSRGWPLD